MSDDEPPWQRIERLVAVRAARSDREILDELRAHPPLPDERDAAWAHPDAWSRAHLLVALADVCALRCLRDAVPLLLEKLCLGDPGEMIRGIRHSLEGIARPDWVWLASRCADALASPRAGTRYWALDELAVLRSPAHVAAIMRALHDTERDVVERAASALVSVAREHSSIAPDAREAIEAAIARRPDARELPRALSDLDRPVTAGPVKAAPKKRAPKTVAAKPSKTKVAARPGKVSPPR